MDNSVGDCLSVMLQEDMLMCRERPYGSRLNAEADNTVKKKSKQGSAQLSNLLSSAYLNEFYLLPELVPPAADEEACMEQRQQPTPPTQIHPEKTERNPPRNQRQQLQV